MKEKWYKLLLIIPVFAVLLAVPLLTLLSFQEGSSLTRTANYSVWENRTMSQKPVLTEESFWDGTYFSQWESFLSDNFYGRDHWMQVYTAYRMERGSANVNNVVLTDQTLLPQNSIPAYTNYDYEANAAAMAANLKKIQQQVADYGGTMLYVGVPEQRSMLRDYYPDYQEANQTHLQNTELAFATAMEQAEVLLLLMRPILAPSENLLELYSTVDHHYTLRGAYETYLAVCEILQEEGFDFPVVTPEHIAFSELPNPYLGTYNRKLYGISPVKEPLLVMESDMEVPFVRTDNGQTVESEVMDLPDTTWEYVYYNLYMGGDQAETVIETGRDELPDILIWGDSFTNAFETIAWMSFDEMRSVDLRYYDEMSLSEYIALYQPDIVLCIRDDLNYLIQEGNGAIQ